MSIEKMTDEELCDLCVTSILESSSGEISDELFLEMDSRGSRVWGILVERTLGSSEDELGLNDPQVVVEPDVKRSIKAYFRKMGLVGGPAGKERKPKKDSPQDSKKTKMWRDGVVKKSFRSP